MEFSLIKTVQKLDIISYICTVFFSAFRAVATRVGKGFIKKQKIFNLYTFTIRLLLCEIDRLRIILVQHFSNADRMFLNVKSGAMPKDLPFLHKSFILNVCVFSFLCNVFLYNEEIACRLIIILCIRCIGFIICCIEINLYVTCIITE